jgi:hypothetical protein
MRRVSFLGAGLPGLPGSGSIESQEGGAAGSIAGSFLPFPGGSMIGNMIGSLIGGLIGGKPSNFSAYAWFSAGPVPVPQPAGVGATRCSGNVCGTEMDAQTAAIGAAVTSALAQAIQSYAAQGVRWNSPAFGVVVGKRDPASIHHAATDGQFYAQNLAQPGDVQGTVLGVWQWLEQFAIVPPQLAAQLQQPQPIVPGQGAQPPPGYAAPGYAQPPQNAYMFPPNYAPPQTAPGAGAVDPLPGGADYHSVQSGSSGTSPAGSQSNQTTPAAQPAGDVLGAMFSSPLLLIAAGVVGAALLFGEK